MQFKNHTVWKMIDAFSFDAQSKGESFSHKLGTAEHWSGSYTQEVMEEYKKFLYLCATTSEVLAPPKVVDLAWSMHMEEHALNYSQLCTLIPPYLIKRTILFMPAPGEKAFIDNDKWFKDQYSNTQQHYKEAFGQLPPAHIWTNQTEELTEHKTANINLGKHLSFALDYRYVCIFILLAGVLLFRIYQHPLPVILGGIVAALYYFYHPSARKKYDIDRDGKGYRQQLRAEEPTL